MMPPRNGSQGLRAWRVWAAPTSLLGMTILLALMLLTPSPAAAETRPFVKGSWQELVSTHSGRPLAVHFWSTTCAPCLAEMPGWAEIRRRHPGLDVVLVATDPMEEAPRQQAVLARFGLAGTESWSFADSWPERLRFEVDRRWRGELPMTRLVDRQGRIEAVTGRVEPAALELWLSRQGDAR